MDDIQFVPRSITGVENIDRMPAFPVRNTSRLVHAASHLPGGPTVSTTLFWIPGAAILLGTP